jgi:hypothetical protein
VSAAWAFQLGQVRRACRLAICACLAVLVAGCVPAPPLAETQSPTVVATGSAAANLPPCAPTPTPGPTILPVYRGEATPDPGQPQVMPSDVRIFGGPLGTHGLPATDGTTVAWADSGDCLHAARVRDGYNYGPITKLPGTVALALSGDIVAWRVTETGPACPPDCPEYIAAVDIATRTAIPLSRTHHSEYAPALSGNWLVWLAEDPLPGQQPTPPTPGAMDRSATYSVLARDLRTPGAPLVLRQTTDRITYLTAEGDRVVWAEQQAAAGGQITVRLFAKDLGDRSAQPMPLGDALGPSQDPGPQVYGVRGDLLLYYDAGQRSLSVWAVNLRTGWRKTFDGISAATTDGRYIFWISAAYATSVKYRQDIEGYDTVTGREFPLAANSGVNIYPLARNGVVVWLHHPGALNFVSQVYATVVSVSAPK